MKHRSSCPSDLPSLPTAAAPKVTATPMTAGSAAFFALVLLLLGLAVVGAGCHGNGPTSPSSGFEIAVIAPLSNSTMAPTIVEAQLVFDGIVVEDPGTESDPVAAITFNPAFFVPTGAHTFSIQIVSQTFSPLRYTVTNPFVQVFDASGTLIKTIQLSTQTAVLPTGGTITYTFTL